MRKSDSSNLTRHRLFGRFETLECMVVEENYYSSDFLLRTGCRDGAHHRCRNVGFAIVGFCGRRGIIRRNRIPIFIAWDRGGCRFTEKIGGRPRCRSPAFFRNGSVHRLLVEKQPVGIYLRKAAQYFLDEIETRFVSPRENMGDPRGLYAEQFGEFARRQILVFHQREQFFAHNR